MNKLWRFLKDKGVDVGVAVGDAVTGGAVSAIAEAVGLDTDDPDALRAQLEENPDLVAKLKQQEAALKIALREIAARDRDSARRREIKVRDRTPSVLAYAILAAFTLNIGAIIMLGVYQVALPEAISNLLYTSAGTLGTLAIGVKEYYFGSSTGSAEKNRIIERLKGAQ